MSYSMTPDIYTAIAASADKLATIKAFSAGFGVDEGEISAAFDSMHEAHELGEKRTAFISTLGAFSIAKTVIRKAHEAHELGLTLTLVVDGESAKLTTTNPSTAKKGKGKKGSPNRYFVDGKPLFDHYRSIKAAMVTLGGFDNVVPAIGPGGANKVNPKYSDTTSMNAWQALQAFGTDSQKARITRTTG